jgi:hypothetical protein
VTVIEQALQSDAKRLKPLERSAPFGERQPLAPRLPNGASQQPGSSSTLQLKPQASAAAAAQAAVGSSGGSGGSLLLKTSHKSAAAGRAEGSQSQTVELEKHSISSTPSQVRPFELYTR